MNMSYSFNYDSKKHFCSKEDSSFDLCDLGDGVTVKAEVCEYKDYDAAQWVLYFENKSDKNSGIFSEIWDSDVLLPLNMP